MFYFLCSISLQSRAWNIKCVQNKNNCIREVRNTWNYGQGIWIRNSPDSIYDKRDLNLGISLCRADICQTMWDVAIGSIIRYLFCFCKGYRLTDCEYPQIYWLWGFKIITVNSQNNFKHNTVLLGAPTSLVLTKLSVTRHCGPRVKQQTLIINTIPLNVWAGAERGYLISLQPKALARSWLLGYLLKTDTQM